MSSKIEAAAKRLMKLSKERQVMYQCFLGRASVGGPYPCEFPRLPFFSGTSISNLSFETKGANAVLLGDEIQHSYRARDSLLRQGRCIHCQVFFTNS